MNSNNVIKFPGAGQNRRKEDKPTVTNTVATKEVSLGRQIMGSKNFAAVLILGFVLFTFNLTYSPSEKGEMALKGEGRSLASVQKSSEADLSKEYDFARKLASLELNSSASQNIGRHSTLDDQVRHGVLAGRAYILKHNISDGNLVSIRLQEDESNPAYLLKPTEFLKRYGEWLNKDFESVSPAPEGESVVGDKRVEKYLITTRSGRIFEVTIERDLFNRLTSLFQTEVAANTF